MRILVYGAGVLGCNLAHALFKSKKDVTLLARGDWYQKIKNNGLRIKSKLSLFTTNDHINVIDHLDKEDEYDIIFVVMQYTQLDGVIDVLNANVTKNVVLVGNNLNCQKYIDLLKEKRVYFGFYSAAGRRDKDRVVSVATNKIIIGGNDKQFIDEVFNSSKIKVQWYDNMDGWLKSHACFILPIAYAVYYADGNLKSIKKDKIAINKVIDAMVEAYEVIMANGYEIVPKEDYIYVKETREKCYKFLKLCFSTFLGKIMAEEHAMNAIGEMNKLRIDFNKYKSKANIDTPNLNELEKCIEKYL